MAVFKLDPQHVWISLASTLGICTGLAGIVWFEARQATRLDFIAETVQDIPQIKEDIAELRGFYQTLAESEKKKNAEAGIEELTGPVLKPVKPDWAFAVPRGWTLGTDGKLKKL